MFVRDPEFLRVPVSGNESALFSLHTSWEKGSQKAYVRQNVSDPHSRITDRAS